MKIAIGNDHAGVYYKNEIIKYLKLENIEVINYGTDTEESVDYPDHIHPVSNFVSNNNGSLGIIICGSGNGAAMTANKRENIRAALCWNNELSRLSREHNDANIISIPARFVSVEEAIQMVKVFSSTKFEGGRHQKRVSKIPC
ncbi:MAG: ribose 5-phosphate isomerase B [Candidatus Marivariicella framensis]|jgi:ribose 5-phosphate isomerase B|tara:strand:- start:587 stop:1015 length:429 start_codon:yes stop_codon:yes gene_type:complete